ncbi:FAD-binding protein [Flaviaesturariibacter flavus]|uniref:FAD-binding protein n=1 Tax=Flaviaesturariibacter flavus TaxID=2502780 RepID=A0A4R1BC24_9BACT|nr:NAD(P)/FAD-dependent oxidoreductase [Flaviaesturariibacter flavus]TCJ14579.1 FAD-binding protein [Flaviaesturariibacter flavus]
MPKEILLRIRPSEAADETSVRRHAAEALALKPDQVSGVQRLRQSLDARGRQAWLQIRALVFIDEPFVPLTPFQLELPDVSKAPKQVIVVGAGPAGLFAALRLMELGIRPIVLERGKDVRARRRDLAAMNKEGVVNPESNYCFGEGGAGTYSDGKLYTRSTKRGDVQRILDLLVQYGADDRIRYEAHPHIGTNKLPHIITAIRDAIIARGGQVLFEKKLTGFKIEKDRVTEVHTADGDTLPADAVLLATGHSARDIFSLLQQKGLQIEFKPFALGVRIEHPQSLIDQGQYHCDIRPEWLPPAAYSLVQQVEGRGVFSFCMCPGGIIAPAATAPGEVVVNGWSPSKRNNPYANSGIVVNITEADIQAYSKMGPLAGVGFQSEVEQKAFAAGGGKLVAPAQRLVDFTKGIHSPALPDCSYLPGIHSVDLRSVLPGFVHASLQQAFKEFGRKIRGYLTNDAVVVATESRTSSPVRIPRDNDTLAHPQASNLYPCAEGAGYAGGIVSAAMDGERVATQIAAVLA